MPRSRCFGMCCSMAAMMLFAAGCIERSVVVKVKKDGSGVVHVRHHGQELGITFGGSSSPPKESRESKLPSHEKLQQLTASMGMGVELASATETENRNGWHGYELVFQFSDINQLVLPETLTGPPKKEVDAESNDVDEETTPDAGTEYRFAMNDGELRIHSLFKQEEAVAAKEGQPKIGTVDPFASEPPATKTNIDIGETAMEQVLAQVLKDMRIGLFVEIDGEIASTNAVHRNENLITLVRVNVGEILASPNGKQHMKSLAALKNAADRRQRTREIAEMIEGLDVDVQDPIMVTFR